MSQTNREAAGVVGTASVVDGELVVSWADGSLETFSPQEREFSEGEAFPRWTFLLWTDEDRGPRSVHLIGPSFEAALSSLEGWLVARSIVPKRVTFISHGQKRPNDLGRNLFVRTIGGYAPLAA